MNSENISDAYCEVYDEPRHQFYLRNDYANVYDIELPHDERTHFHRHSEDTVYFAISDANVEESFHDKPSVETTASLGGTLCRAHKDEPLIHQVRNVGRDTMHMVGAEALARPPEPATTPHADPYHELSWSSDRFRVYTVSADTPGIQLDYNVYGLFVSLTTLQIQLNQHSDTSDESLLGLKPGSFVWMEGRTTVTFRASGRALFAQWI